MDGKKDWQDSFLKYNIFNSCTEGEDNDDLFDSDDEFLESSDKE